MSHYIILVIVAKSQEVKLLRKAVAKKGCFASVIDNDDDDDQ
jgi:hypothetical protein